MTYCLEAVYSAELGVFIFICMMRTGVCRIDDRSVKGRKCIGGGYIMRVAVTQGS